MNAHGFIAMTLLLIPFLCNRTAEPETTASPDVPWEVNCRFHTEKTVRIVSTQTCSSISKGFIEIVSLELWQGAPGLAIQESVEADEANSRDELALRPAVFVVNESKQST